MNNVKKRHTDTTLPPLPVSFEDAVKALLRTPPPPAGDPSNRKKKAAAPKRRRPK
jgi:hypothetical protein